MAKIVYAITKELALFCFSVTSASFNNVETCRTRSICSSRDFENILISSKYTRAHCHWPIIVWCPLRVERSRVRFQPECRSSILEQSVVRCKSGLSRSYATISTCQYLVLGSIAEKKLWHHKESWRISPFVLWDKSPEWLLRLACVSPLIIRLSCLSSVRTRCVPPILFGSVR